MFQIHQLRILGSDRYTLDIVYHDRHCTVLTQHSAECSVSTVQDLVTLRWWHKPQQLNCSHTSDNMLKINLWSTEKSSQSWWFGGEEKDLKRAELPFFKVSVHGCFTDPLKRSQLDMKIGEAK